MNIFKPRGKTFNRTVALVRISAHPRDAATDIASADFLILMHIKILFLRRRKSRRELYDFYVING